jgi:hypothetical protein
MNNTEDISIPEPFKEPINEDTRLSDSARKQEREYEQLRYNRQWQENERTYTRRQSNWRFLNYLMLAWATLVIFYLLAFQKIELERSAREVSQLPTQIATQVPPSLHPQANVPNSMPPTVLLVEPSGLNDMPSKLTERNGVPVVPSEIFVKLIDKLFEGGTSAVRTTGDVTKKFAESGMRVGEDAAKQILAALLRPSKEPTPVAGTPAGTPLTPTLTSAQTIAPIHVFMNCAPNRTSVTPTPNPTSVRRPPRCTPAPSPVSTDLVPSQK